MFPCHPSDHTVPPCPVLGLALLLLSPECSLRSNAIYLCGDHKNIHIILVKCVSGLAVIIECLKSQDQGDTSHNIEYLVFFSNLHQFDHHGDLVPGEGGHHHPLVPIIQQLGLWDSI